MHVPRFVVAALRCVLALVAACSAVDAQAKGKLLIRVVDAEGGGVLPFRIHLKNQARVPVKVPQLPFWHDHVSSPGPLQLELLRGNYFFEIEHGPEYVNATGFFTLNDGADDEKEVKLRRACNMAAAGWWSGDLDVRRPARELETAMAADDLYVVPLLTRSGRASPGAPTQPPPKTSVVTFDGRRTYDLLGGADDRPGGPLHWFGLDAPLPIDEASQPLAARLPELAELAASHPAAHVDVAEAAAWDLPLWIAAGRVDSVALLSPQLRRDKVVPSSAVRPFDRKLHLPATGSAEYAQEIYFHLLNCGLRIAPSAGSGSGAGAGPNAVGNPVGYNRVYVQVPPAQFNYAAWREGLKAGRVVVTNGPLMRPKANDAPPGYIFASTAGAPVTLDLAMELTTRDKVSYVEVIRNGRVAQTLPLRDWAQGGGRFAPLTFDESGWCLVRVRCDVPETYRMAMSAPWYVEFDGKPRISKTSAQFFLDWIEARAAMLAADKSVDAQAVAAAVDQARKFWTAVAAQANAP